MLLIFNIVSVMRNFILLLCLAFTFNSSYAQKLNYQGKKMVSSIICFTPNKVDTTKYNFYYDEKNHLIKFVKIRKGKVYFPNVGWVKDKTFRMCNRMEYKNGTLQRIDYDEYGNIKKDYVYSYILDSDRYIIERTFKNISLIDRSYQKSVIRFTYDYPYKDNIRQLIKETESSFIGNVVKGKLVEKEIINDRHTTLYDVIDGNTYRNRQNIKYACAYDDLNVNIRYLIGGDDERITEWYNIYSECLPEEKDCLNYRYFFTNSEPYNLYRVERYIKNKIIITFLIEYVY